MMWRVNISRAELIDVLDAFDAVLLRTIQN